MKYFIHIIILLLSINVMALENDSVDTDAAEEEQQIQELDTELVDEVEELKAAGQITFSDAKKLSLRILNKITARAYDLKINVDEVENFGSLEILVKQCRTKEQDEVQEDMALIEIGETFKGVEKKKLFYGWIFANSPALSSLEHPVYFITLIKCDY
jgi:hypothetical protein